MDMVIPVIVAFLLYGQNGGWCCDGNNPHMWSQHHFHQQAASTLNSRKPSLKTGGKTFSENCTCDGIEKPGYGRGIRYYDVTCRNKGRTLTCSYRGDPHQCSAYNTRQREFYAQLLNCIGHNMCLEPFGNCPARKDGYYARMCSRTDKANFKLDTRNIPRSNVCRR